MAPGNTPPRRIAIIYTSRWLVPWAHRIIIARRLKGLENVIGMTVVDPVRDERGWAFREGAGYSTDPVNGFKFLSEAYTATDPAFRRDASPCRCSGISKLRRIASNSDDDLLRILNTEFNAFATNPNA